MYKKVYSVGIASSQTGKMCVGWDDYIFATNLYNFFICVFGEF